MAIATAMNININNVDINTITKTNTNNLNQLHQHMDDDQEDDEDGHDYDTVMPGFRFHPTEEELVEFYLRRKVEGKPFNAELISFIDLYRYDPWELPALAAIGDKEWFFYVPRDRKYRNGDRPNRVTTSGYWKATGADRMIRGERFRAIGLKKTLVFYSGKAPKGTRTSWIMHEYRLPQHDPERYPKAEISLCKVYKRAGVEDHPSVPRAPPSSSERKTYHTAFKAQSSSLYNHNHHRRHQVDHKVSDTSETDASSSTEGGIALGLFHHSSYTAMYPPTILSLPPPPPPPPSLPPNVLGSSSLRTTPTNQNHHQPSFEEIQKLVECQQPYLNHHHFQQQHHHLQFEKLTSDSGINITTTAATTTITTATNSQFLFSNYFISPSPQTVLINNPVLAAAMLPPPTGSGTALWDWNLFPEANKDHFNSFFR